MKFPKTSSSESPSGRARQRARPVALADRSVSPGEAKHRDSPKLNGDLEEHFPVSLSNAPRGSLRSVLEDVDLPELPCSPTGSTGPPVRTSHTMPGARPRIRALSALSSDLSMKTDHLGLERSLVTKQSTSHNKRKMQGNMQGRKEGRKEGQGAARRGMGRGRKDDTASSWKQARRDGGR